MREILFRAKSLKTGEWVYGGYFKHLNRTPNPVGGRIKESDFVHYIFVSGYSDWNMPKPVEETEVDGETVGQWTGLVDCKGNKIFEGDFISEEMIDDKGESVGFTQENFTLIDWRDCGFVFVSNPFSEHEFCEKFSCDEIEGNQLSCIVIGNRFQNPELIKE